MYVNWHGAPTTERNLEPIKCNTVYNYKARDEESVTRLHMLRMQKLNTHNAASWCDLKRDYQIPISVDQLDCHLYKAKLWLTL